MSDNTIVEYLSEHPKMTGVLFTMLLLLAEAGGIATAHGSAVSGT